MSPSRSKNHHVRLVLEFSKQPRETDWVQFKVNKETPKEIGERTAAGCTCLGS